MDALREHIPGRNADGSYDSLFQSFDIIRCASGITTQAPEDPEALLAKIRDEAPRFGGFVTLEDLIPDEGEEDDFDGCHALTGEVAPAALDYRGEHQGEVTFDLTLDSAGLLTFAVI